MPIYEYNDLFLQIGTMLISRNGREPIIAPKSHQSSGVAFSNVDLGKPRCNGRVVFGHVAAFHQCATASSPIVWGIGGALVSDPRQRRHVASGRRLIIVA